MILLKGISNETSVAILYSKTAKVNRKNFNAPLPSSTNLLRALGKT
jgi:hypothetical protein